MRTRHRVWKWTDKGGAEKPPRPAKDMKDLKEHKGWAYMAFILEVEEEDQRKKMEQEAERAAALARKKAADSGLAVEEMEDQAATGATTTTGYDATAKELAYNDTSAVAKLTVFFCLRVTKPPKARLLTMSDPKYDYFVIDQNIMGASHFTMTAGSEEGDIGAFGKSFDASKSNVGNSTTDFGRTTTGGALKSGKTTGLGGKKGMDTMGEGLKSTKMSMTAKKDEAAEEDADGMPKVAEKDTLEADFTRMQLESFLPLVLPFAINEAAAAGLLSISPQVFNTPEFREACRNAITMPDIFLSRALVPELVPTCTAKATSDLLSKLSVRTLNEEAPEQEKQRQQPTTPAEGSLADTQSDARCHANA